MADPDNTPTTKLAQVDPIVELTKEIRNGQARTDANFDIVIGQQQTHGKAIESLQGQVNDVVDRVTTLEQRTGNHSGGIRELSGHDLSQDAQIAAVLIEQAELKKRGFWGPFFERVDRAILAVWRDPKARLLALAILLGILARFGIHIEVPK